MAGARLIAIEGIDGSGKGTQAKRLVTRLQRRGLTTALLSFPRYGDTLFGRAIGEFLNGSFGSLDQVHPQLAALLFAGDRFESRTLLLQMMADHDVVVLDRYVASNIAHQGAKLPASARGQLVDFISQLEFGVYALPRPDLKILLDVSIEQSQQLITLKDSRDYTDLVADLQEADTDYMTRVRSVYRDLAASEPGWFRIACQSGGVLRSIESVSDEILQLVLADSSGVQP